MAHSVDGVGAYMYVDPTDSSQKTCMEVSFLFAYKNKGACLATFAHTQELRVHDLSCIDNVKGLSLITGSHDHDDVKITLYDSKFFGESLSDDCPNSSLNVECFCENRAAIMLFSNQNDIKPLMPTDSSDLPIFKSKGIGNWGGVIQLL